MRTCIRCRAYFVQHAGRGRPRVLCYGCAPLGDAKAAKRAWDDVHREAECHRKRQRYHADPDSANAKRMALYRETNPLSPKTCATCGEIFTPPQRMQQRYCSVECSRKAHPRRTRPGVPKNVRRRVLLRDNWTCYLCGGAIPEWLQWPHQLFGTADHVIPWKHGGKATLDNLRAAHWACNREKSDKLLEAA